MSRIKQKINNQIKKTRSRSYVARDFTSFRAELYDYAKSYFGDQINDFSEASVGGLFLDMAAMVGDTMSFYLDHQFNELNWETAVETKNIQRHLRSAGVKQYGVSPAVVSVMFSAIVPARIERSEYVPHSGLLPTVGQGTVVSGGGVTFVTVEDLHLWENDRVGNLIAATTVHGSDENGNPSTFLVEREVVCISGKEATESFNIPLTHKPFRKISLARQSITEILRVSDASGNEYFEVESLSQDTVFRGIINLDDDYELVENNLEIVPAPYRFTVVPDVVTKSTKLQFGGGDASSLDDDIIPDPSDMSLPLYGKTIFSRFSIDPESMLKTQTLGVAPKGTTLTIRYRYGGGLNHNVQPDRIKTITMLYAKWPLLDNPTLEEIKLMKTMKTKLRVSNLYPAAGGSPAPDIEDLRAQIPAVRSMQSRVVSKEDLLARIYTLPSKFGRVFRAGIHQNPNNPLAAELYIVCMNKRRQLCTAPDTLKRNLRTYLNEFRLISDAIEILDAQVINFKLDFDIVVNPKYNKIMVIQQIIVKLKKLLGIKMYQIDQPIIMVDLMNVIINTDGVLTMTGINVTTMRGIVEDRVYSALSFDVDANSAKGLIVGPPGSIFELRYPKHDIIGNAS
jgi:hypothetical protein